ncbi:hypothetical protein CDC7B_1798 [Corynebacterium diphtheriae C7 (beta)]|nr:hypothetical protein CDC7B_1798 [Corynebacterium diphtheriae C7 (beta)]AEX70457.1 hypothetical protein CDPW8_1809 [Corynebacterium diphtheriae PW8]
MPHHTLRKSYKETAITLDSSDLNRVASFSVVYLLPAVSLVPVHNKATIAGTFRINSYLSSKRK